jgi:hypothetical protein
MNQDKNSSSKPYAPPSSSGSSTPISVSAMSIIVSTPISTLHLKKFDLIDNLINKTPVINQEIVGLFDEYISNNLIDPEINKYSEAKSYFPSFTDEIKNKSILLYSFINIINKNKTKLKEITDCIEELIKLKIDDTKILELLKNKFNSEDLLVVNQLINYETNFKGEDFKDTINFYIEFSDAVGL